MNNSVDLKFATLHAIDNADLGPRLTVDTKQRIYQPKATMTFSGIADVNLDLSYDNSKMGTDGKGILTGKATYNGAISGMSSPWIGFSYENGTLQLLNWDFFCDMGSILELAKAIDEVSKKRQEKYGVRVREMFNKALTTEFSVSLAGISAEGGFAMVGLKGTYVVKVPSVQRDPDCRVVMDPISIRIPISIGKDGVEGVIRDTWKENIAGISKALIDNWGNVVNVLLLVHWDRILEVEARGRGVVS